MKKKSKFLLSSLIIASTIVTVSSITTPLVINQQNSSVNTSNQTNKRINNQSTNSNLMMQSRMQSRSVPLTTKWNPYIVRDYLRDGIVQIPRSNYSFWWDCNINNVYDFLSTGNPSLTNYPNVQQWIVRNNYTLFQNTANIQTSDVLVSNVLISDNGTSVSFDVQLKNCYINSNTPVNKFSNVFSIKIDSFNPLSVNSHFGNWDGDTHFQIVDNTIVTNNSPYRTANLSNMTPSQFLASIGAYYQNNLYSAVSYDPTIGIFNQGTIPSLNNVIAFAPIIKYNKPFYINFIVDNRSGLLKAQLVPAIDFVNYQPIVQNPSIVSKIYEATFSCRPGVTNIKSSLGNLYDCSSFPQSWNITDCVNYINSNLSVLDYWLGYADNTSACSPNQRLIENLIWADSSINQNAPTSHTIKFIDCNAQAGIARYEFTFNNAWATNDGVLASKSVILSFRAKPDLGFGYRWNETQRFLSKDDFVQKLVNDINNGNNIFQQHFIQSLITFYNTDLSKLKVISYTLNPVPNEPNALLLSFKYNYDHGTGTTNSEKIILQSPQETGFIGVSNVNSSFNLDLSDKFLDFKRFGKIEFHPVINDNQEKLKNPIQITTYPYAPFVIDDSLYLKKIIASQMVNLPSGFDPLNDMFAYSDQFQMNASGWLRLSNLNFKKWNEIDPATGKIRTVSKNLRGIWLERFKVPWTSTLLTGRTDYFDKIVPQVKGCSWNLNSNTKYESLTPSQVAELFSKGDFNDKRQIIEDLISFNNFMMADSNGRILPEFEDYLWKYVFYNNTDCKINVRADTNRNILIIEIPLRYYFYDTGDIDYNQKEVKVYKVVINMFRSQGQPTTLSQNIYCDLADFKNYYASQFYEEVKNNVNTTLIRKLKEYIYDNYLLFFPTADAVGYHNHIISYRDYFIDDIMSIIIKPTQNPSSEYSNDPIQASLNNTTKYLPYVDLVLELKTFYDIDSNGNVVLSLPNKYRTKQFNFRLFANYKLIKNTEINTNKTVTLNFAGVSNIKPSAWVLNQSLQQRNEIIKRAVVNSYYGLNGVSQISDLFLGTVPGDINLNNRLTENNIEINDSISYVVDDLHGYVSVYLALNKWWKVTKDPTNANLQKSILIGEDNNNTTDFTSPWVEVKFDGFEAIGATVLPDNDSRYDISNLWGAKHKASDSRTASSSMQNNSIPLNDLKTYILKGLQSSVGISFGPVIRGDKTNISINDLNIQNYSFASTSLNPINYNGTPNDITGELTVDLILDKIWIKDNNAQYATLWTNPTPGQKVDKDGKPFNYRQIVLYGFKKQEPTEIPTKINVNGFTETSSNLKCGSLFPSEFVNLPNYANDINTWISRAGQNWVSSTNPLQDFKATVASRDNLNGTITINLDLNKYYDQTNGLLNDTKKSLSILLTGFQQSSPTEFVNQGNPSQIYDISNFNDLSVNFLKNCYPQELSEALNKQTNEPLFNNPKNRVDLINENLKDFVFQCVLQGNKKTITTNDIYINALPNFSNINGSLTIDFRLDKHYDANGELSTTPINWSINLNGFKKVTAETIYSLKVTLPTNSSLTLLKCQNFVDKINTAVKNSATIIDPVLEETKKVIFDNCISIGKEYLKVDDVVITSAAVNANNKSNADVSFYLKKLWIRKNNDILLVDNTNNNMNKNEKVIISPFTSEAGTYFTQGIDIKALPYYQYFLDSQLKANNEIAYKLPSVWIKEIQQQGSTASVELENLIRTYGTKGIIYNLPPGYSLDAGNPNSIKFNIAIDQRQNAVDDKLGTITFDIKMSPYLLDNGSIEQNKPLNVKFKLSGFMCIGPTIINGGRYSINGSNLQTDVTNNNLTPIDISLDPTTSQVKPISVQDSLKQLIFDNCVKGYKPQGDPATEITKNNIVIKNIYNQNSFDGTLQVDFTLNRYYELNSTTGKVDLIDNKEGPSVQTISLYDFPKYKNEGNGSTSFNASGNITHNKSSNANPFVDSNNKAKYYADIFVKTPSLITSLETWVFDNLVDGEKKYLNIPNNEINLSVTSYNIVSGEVEISYTFNYVWVNGQLKPDTNPHTATISGFKKTNKTEFVQVPELNVRSKNWDIPLYDKDPTKGLISGEEFKKEIEKCDDPKKLLTSNDLRDDLEYFIKYFVIINYDKLIENLPEPLINEINTQLNSIPSGLSDRDKQKQRQEKLYKILGDQIRIVNLRDSITVKNSGIMFDIELYYYNKIINNSLDTIGPYDATKPANNPANIITPLVGYNYLLTGFNVLAVTEIIHDKLIIDISKKYSNPVQSTDKIGWWVVTDELYSTIRNKNNASNETKYYWKNSTVNELKENLVSVLNQNKNNEFINGNINSTDVSSNMLYVIKQAILDLNVSNGNNTGIDDINLSLQTSNTNWDNNHGVISGIEYTITKGNYRDPTTNKVVSGSVNLKGEIILKGFIVPTTNLNVDSTLSWWVILAIVLGSICIIAIIIIIIYRRRHDVEYGK